MKILKSKFTKYGVMAVGLVLFFVASCQKDETIESVPVVSLEELRLKLEADPDFASLKLLNTDLSNQVAKALQEKGLTGEDIKNLYQNNELDQLQEIFENEQITQGMSQIMLLHESLNSNYSELIEEEPVSENEIATLDDFNNFIEVSSLENRCSKGANYYRCINYAYSRYRACLFFNQITSTRCFLYYVISIGQCRRVYC